MQWYSPWALALFLLLPVMGYLTLRKKRTAAVKFSSVSQANRCAVSWRLKLRPLLAFARLLCLALLIIALARPRKGTALSEISTEAVAIEVVVDRSSSMMTEMDFYGSKLDRLEVAKKVLVDFINGDKKELKGRTGDIIGLITFARYADTLCPLVSGHNVLLEFLKTTQIVDPRTAPGEDGTAIGDAIALAAARLKKSEEEIKNRRKLLGLGGETEQEFSIKSKVIVLLTDGRNNIGQYDPMQAAELAKEWGIKIYTIGIGSLNAYTTIQTPLGSFKMPAAQDLDEALLKRIAQATGGVYGRADDGESFLRVVKTIDELEKTDVKAVQYTQYAEHFGPWTLAALAALAAEIMAGCTIFRKIP